MTSEPPGGIRLEPCAKRVRAYLAGQLVVDTSAAMLVWEHPHYPTYYLPVADVRSDLLPAEAQPSDGVVEHVRAGGYLAQRAATRFPDSATAALRDLVRLDWKSMQAWFEEDEPVYTHPRDPHTRVDILATSRHVVAAVGGVSLADSVRAHILFETGLPARYYLPWTDVRMDLLSPSATRTHCPYKGDAQYWHVHVDGVEHADLAWSYPTPLPESQKIAGLVCLHHERLDAFTVDGQPPAT